MINRDNYYEILKGVNFREMDADMKAMKIQVDKITLYGTDWTAYENNTTVKETFDLYFQALALEIKYVKPEKSTKTESSKPPRKSLKNNVPIKRSSKSDAHKKTTKKEEVEIETIEETLLNSKNVRQKMPKHQQMILVDEHIDIVKRLEKELSIIPKMYSQDGKDRNDVTVHTHYFHGQSHWFITEESKKDKLFYGYTILNGDSQMSEAGSLQIYNFVHNGKVELDFHWKKKSLAQALYDADPDYFEEPKKVQKKDVNTTKSQKVTKKNKSNRTKKVLRPVANPNAKKVESISLELKFIKRFITMNGKSKTRNQIRLFINALQKAIKERKIKKESKYAKEIIEIQSALIKFHERFKTDTQTELVTLTDKTITKYKKLIGQQSELISVKLIKSYINLQGKVVPNKKAANLFNRISRAVDQGKLTKSDKYWTEIKTILNQLETFVKKNPSEGMLRIEERALNGLRDLIPTKGSKKSILPRAIDIAFITGMYGEGMRSTTDNRFMMSSKDMVDLKFNHIGLNNKWFNFLGDPEVGFRMATFGAPKMGKSYLMVEFAGYLAMNHGKVLYIAKEEGKSATFKKKLKDTHSSHSNMIVSNYIPENLQDFDFVFFDSVTKLGLTPKNLIAINLAFPKTSFLEIHQVTKDGKARGVNDFLHDVDGLIEVYEKGKARQNGRFNQGGELDFFDEEVA